jgi:hypothetical protein
MQLFSDMYHFFHDLNDLVGLVISNSETKQAAAEATAFIS